MSNDTFPYIPTLAGLRRSFRRLLWNIHHRPRFWRHYIAVQRDGTAMGNRLPESVLGVQTRICWIVLVLAKAATAETLPQCLSAAQVSAIYPQDEEYDRARQVANARIDRFPIAVAYPGTAAQVANIVICAREYNVSVAARGGGHSYEGASSRPWSRSRYVPRRRHSARLRFFRVLVVQLPAVSQRACR